MLQPLLQPFALNASSLGERARLRGEGSASAFGQALLFPELRGRGDMHRPSKAPSDPPVRHAARSARTALLLLQHCPPAAGRPDTHTGRGLQKQSPPLGRSAPVTRFFDSAQERLRVRLSPSSACCSLNSCQDNKSCKNNQLSLVSTRREGGNGSSFVCEWMQIEGLGCLSLFLLPGKNALLVTRGECSFQIKNN